MKAIITAASFVLVATFASSSNAAVVCTGVDSSNAKLTLTLNSLDASTGTLNYLGFENKEATCVMKSENNNVCEFAVGDSSIVIMINVEAALGAFSFTSNANAEGSNPVSSGIVSCK